MSYQQAMISLGCVARTISFVISVCGKSSLLTYAGLLLILPIATGGSDWPSRLSYDAIFNSTSYAQLPLLLDQDGARNGYQQQRFTPVTHRQHLASHTYNRFSDETKGNEVEIDYIEDKKDKLLVGFARDPFRISIPDEDYRKGVRNIDSQTYTNKGDRGKRGVLHLYNMIYCATGCEPLAYKGYGCYCGFLGAGRPTDGIDRCCKMHDQCYENIYCPFYTVYFQPYYWKCYHNEPLCALENYHTQNQLVNGCAGRLCECDRQFAMCVRRYSCPRGRALCRSSPVRLLQNILMFK